MYDRDLANCILRKMDEMFPTPTTSDDLWEFQLPGFKDRP
jgi:hypothetical protein